MRQHILVICRVKRHEAVTCLKEITRACPSLSPYSITHYCSNAIECKSNDYEVHIKTLLDADNKQLLKYIAEKYSLTLREENGKVIIYKPSKLTKAV